ncbi:MAG: crossover junction endodeoxyribonuclease RuvC [Candidatus Peregrinibacteria bacterium]|nr:crossover junction endodeoxyribonuclease RuvC [Candidatus Peregrinibacteria bacterium]
MRILGIDPGLATVGIGIVDVRSSHDMTAVEWMTITTPAGMRSEERLGEIFRDLTKLIQEVKPDLAVVEKLFFATNKRTAMDVAQARGVILLSLTEAAIPLLEPTPLQLKSCIAGYGAAPKDQVLDMIVRTLKLTTIPTPDDAADALGLALYGALNHRLAALVDGRKTW